VDGNGSGEWERGKGNVEMVGWWVDMIPYQGRLLRLISGLGGWRLGANGEVLAERHPMHKHTISVASREQFL
jgi:hypothetical protein